MLASARLQTLIWTARMVEAERFYGHALGLPFKRKCHGALVYDVGGDELRVSPVPATQPSEHTVAGFAVADIDAAMASLSARGVTWERFPGLPQDAAGILQTPEGAKVAWCRDPDGNILSVVQYAG